MRLAFAAEAQMLAGVVSDDAMLRQQDSILVLQSLEPARLEIVDSTRFGSIVPYRNEA
jgi:hypothetical protein